MIDLTFEFRRDSLTLPINPENIEISEPGDNQKANVVGLGEIVIPRERGLASFQISSFFPDDGDLEFFKTWRDAKRTGHFTADGLGVDMNVVIDDFSFDRRAGEEDRVYYELSLSEYRPYGARIVVMPTPTTAQPGADQRSDNKPPTGGTYTVKSGDSLWAISKRLSGSGNNWPELYSVNKAVVGSNPNLIYPGQTLTLPSSWRT